jgi:hypothetical protein
LAEDFGEVGDIQFTVRQQRKQAQARWFARGAQGAEHGGKGSIAGVYRALFRHKDMFMRYLTPMQEGLTQGRA